MDSKVISLRAVKAEKQRLRNSIKDMEDARQAIDMLVVRVFDLERDLALAVSELEKRVEDLEGK